MVSLSERSFRVRKVIPFLKQLPNTCYFPIQQVAIVGDPDFILCIRGHFVALELKREGGKLSAMQGFKLTSVIADGWGYAIVAHPGNWKEVKTILSAYAKGDFDVDPNL